MWQQFSYQDAHGSHPYSVYTPERFPFRSPVPLIVMLHGCTQTALDFARGTGMNLLAEQYGFVVLYPQQTRTANQNLCWNWFLPANQQRGSGEPASIVDITLWAAEVIYEEHKDPLYAPPPLLRRMVLAG